MSRKSWVDLWAPAPEPPTKLGYYRLLSPSASVRVSPLCLGAMNIGTAWGDFLGPVTQEDAFKLLDYFYESGGNFIDTANNYQDEQSEQWIGDWMKKRQNRAEMVIATKFTSPYKSYKRDQTIQTNYVGNSRKHLIVSLEDSLRKLQTDYIDVLYVHWWDFTMSVEEMMRSLNYLVQSGKVLYLGVSDTPAWVVSKANQYARDHGLAPFVVYQGKWSVVDRDFEREIIPMCRDENMGIAPWGALGSGYLKTEAQLKEMEAKNEKGRQVFGGITQKHRDLTAILEKIGNKYGVGVTGVALSYVMHKAPYVYPIVGGRKIEHLKGNIEALEKVRLTEEDIKTIEDASPIDLGFPHNMLGGNGGHPSGNPLLGNASRHEFQAYPTSIDAVKSERAGTVGKATQA
ncbi:uncharacterized protein SPPG_06823 [Spizellomyces punctatus DAOM BR117]|uniref:NADP-dependent oxidoreductase domain-containing protein n=2 Tax=Spizellomyces punctatus TaxID=109760 RepID=A0A0L0H9G1_SPIPD|nr:uncharacterized protein SPPG_06823 [Spizellomyces punctatus DAOM BR117]KNC97827.1 hypothetical protein SPPG_06823 [Spizellomyces punctatus DAOM BR117]|eukprot:XP_016605867.1 hypothetical protein SPPG_06823 [Spizellomyces punctatus DAOM BR117]